MGGKRYTRDEIFNLLCGVRDHGDLQLLYREDCVRYTSNLKGTRILASEAVAEWLCRESACDTTNFNLWKAAIESSAQKRSKGYDVNHTQCDSVKDSHRYEEFIAYGLAYDCERAIPLPVISGNLGRITGYQIPLNNAKYDGLGKIDLVSYDEDANEVIFVELKQNNSRESLLRCILEAYTYLKWIADLSIFRVSFGIPHESRFTICPAVFSGTKAADVMERIERKDDSVSNMISLIKLIESDIGTKVRFVLLDSTSPRVKEYRKGILKPKPSTMLIINN